MTLLDWIIISLFFACLGSIAWVTKRMTTSVAGFLSSERLAGRYLLTVSQSMAFLAAIGVIGSFESLYRNGLGGHWWGMMYAPIGAVIALTGFVIYRYRETRVLTMAQFIEARYSRRLRIFTGSLGFISGVLNCAVFPMVTANFLLYFLQLPTSFGVMGLDVSTYHVLVFEMVAGAVTMAISGGQIAIMVTDFFQGVIATLGIVVGSIFLLYHIGWSRILDTLLASERIQEPASQELQSGFSRPEGVSMLNPFKLDGLPDFGLAFFVMMGILVIAKTGVWQGGAGYMTAARTPHEARMGNILSSWRWLMIGVGTLIFAISAYTVAWNPDFAAEQENIRAMADGIEDSYLQSQMFVPLVLFETLPAGLIGLFVIFMVGASISTDNSAYHSWGSMFLQDVVIPLRNRTFDTREHLTLLRWSIVLIGVIAFVFSSLWTMKDFIFMWVEITGAIYVGGASCAIIGGLYWSRGTTAGAWAGMITGSVVSFGGIIARQIWPEMTFPWNDQIINGLYIAVGAVALAYVVYIAVSLCTCRKPHNMDRLLHRGVYSVENDNLIKGEPVPKLKQLKLRWIGINKDFTRLDTCVYLAMIGWVTLMSAVFVAGTVYSFRVNPGSEVWRTGWTWLLGLQGFVSLVTAIWFACGGFRDVTRLFRDLARVKVDEADDGFTPDPAGGAASFDRDENDRDSLRTTAVTKTTSTK